MSLSSETEVGRVSSTTASGKYLNPDVYDGFFDEVHSKPTPLDLLIEACNNIGKDRGQGQKPETKPFQRFEGSPRREDRRRCHGYGDRRENAERADGKFQSVHGISSPEDQLKVRPLKVVKNDLDGDDLSWSKSPSYACVSQDVPEDLRSWRSQGGGCQDGERKSSPGGGCRDGKRKRSPGGGCRDGKRNSSSADGCSVCETYQSPSLGSSPTISSLSPFSPAVEKYDITRCDVTPCSQTTYHREAETQSTRFERNSQKFEREPEKRDWKEDERCDLGTRRSASPYLLQRYLELQWLTYLANLHDQKDELRHLTVNKPMTTLTNPLLPAGGGATDSLDGQLALSEALANYALLLRLQQAELAEKHLQTTNALSGCGGSGGGAFHPFSLPYSIGMAAAAAAAAAAAPSSSFQSNLNISQSIFNPHLADNFGRTLPGLFPFGQSGFSLDQLQLGSGSRPEELRHARHPTTAIPEEFVLLPLPELYRLGVELGSSLSSSYGGDSFQRPGFSQRHHPYRKNDLLQGASLRNLFH